MSTTLLHAWAIGAVAALVVGVVWAQGRPDDGPPGPERMQALVRLVRQDCGSCHGLRLTGGLGPALTRQALADFPLPNLVAVILHGRPGTPMPPWRAWLSESEALWIAERLREGFPALPEDTQ